MIVPPTGIESLSSLLSEVDLDLSFSSLAHSCGSLLAAADEAALKPDFVPVGIWKAIVHTIDVALDAASRSDMASADFKLNGIFAFNSLSSCLLLLRSEINFKKVEKNFEKLSDEMAPLTNKDRRQMLELATTKVEVLDRRTVVSLMAPTQLPGLTEDSITLERYGERVLVLKYDHDGMKKDWFVELPAGKVFADEDSKLAFDFAPPKESKLSTSKTCQITLTAPLVIDAANATSIGSRLKLVRALLSSRFAK